MSLTEPTISYRRLADGFRAEGRLPSSEAPTFTPATRNFVAAALEVDLEQVYADALAKKARSLEVFADVVYVSKDFSHTLGGELGLVSIVARRILVEAGARATLGLSYDPSRDRQALFRVVAAEVVGEFVVRAPKAEPVDLRLELAPELALRFTSLSSDGTDVRRGQGALPMEMLGEERPLYRVLAASFDLAAGVVRDAAPSAEHTALARAILHWLVRWAAYPTSGPGRLFQDAEALGRALPRPDKSGALLRPIPRHTPNALLELARGDAEVAEKYELDASFLRVEQQTKEVTVKLVRAWRERDSANLAAIAEELGAARQLVKVSQEAVNKAAGEMDQRKLEMTLQTIDYETIVNQDRLLNIVKGTFEVLFGVIQLGVAIAGACVNPGLGGALAGANPLGFIKPAIGPAPPMAPSVVLEALGNMYMLPSTLIAELVSMSPKHKKALGKSLSGVGAALPRLLGAATKLLHVDAPVQTADEIGQLVSVTTSVPDVLESKAIWDAFEVESNNKLDFILNDNDASLKLKTATRDIKTTLQKFAILARQCAEQQSLLAQRLRDLGTLLIRQAAEQKRQQVLEGLTTELNDDPKVLLRAMQQARLTELGRSFCTHLNTYRAAYTYQNLRWSAKMPILSVPRNATEMKEQLNDVARVEQPRNAGDFSKALRLTPDRHPALFAGLRSDQQCGTFAITLDDEAFAGHSLVRVARMRVKLGDRDGARVATLLTSGARFSDRYGATELAFQGEPVALASELRGGVLEYDPLIEGVRPTPFTTWTLSVSGSDLALDAVTVVEIEILGKSLKLSN